MSLPSTGAQPPLVAAYLADLDRALLGADPQERADTLAAVSEHIDESLAGVDDRTGEQVRRVLDELGPVDRIAAAATPVSPVSPVTPTGPQTDARWIGPAVLGAAVASLVLLVAAPLLGAGGFLVLTPALALATLVVSIARLRRPTHYRGLLQAAAALSAVILLATVVFSVFFLPVGPINPEPADVQTAQPQHG